VAKPAEIALKVTSASEAQRYRSRWFEQIEDPDASGNVRELQDGIDILERRFGEQLPADPSVPSLRRGKGSVGDGRRSHEKLRREQVPGETRLERRARRRSRGRSSARGFVTGFGVGRYTAPRLAGETGLPDVAWSTTQLVLYAIGGVIGLSVLYLVLTNSEGKGRFPVLTTLLGGVEHGIQRIVQPVDPLGASTAAAAVGGTAPAGPLGPAGLLGTQTHTPTVVTKKVSPTNPHLVTKTLGG
jgi:hypothetical protein